MTKSDKLYEILEDYWYTAVMDKDTIMQIVEDHLDDIIKSKDMLKLDLTTLDKDILYYIEKEYLNAYPMLFVPEPDDDHHVGSKRVLEMSSEFKDAIKLLRKAILDVTRDKFLRGGIDEN